MRIAFLITEFLFSVLLLVKLLLLLFSPRANNLYYSYDSKVCICMHDDGSRFIEENTNQGRHLKEVETLPPTFIISFFFPFPFPTNSKETIKTQFIRDFESFKFLRQPFVDDVFHSFFL